MSGPDYISKRSVASKNIGRPRIEPIDTAGVVTVAIALDASDSISISFFQFIL